MKDQNHVQLRHLRGLAVFGVVMMLGVACGGSDSASIETNAPATTDGSVTSDPVENASNRDGQTIKVGVVNNDSLLPAFRIGAEVAIAAINTPTSTRPTSGSDFASDERRIISGSRSDSAM